MPVTEVDEDDMLIFLYQERDQDMGIGVFDDQRGIAFAVISADLRVGVVSVNVVCVLVFFGKTLLTVNAVGLFRLVINDPDIILF